MNKKSFIVSTEIWAGGALLIMGLVALALGWHGLVPQALAPFGIGLILSDILTRAGKAAREGAKVIVRRDDE